MSNVHLDVKQSIKLRKPGTLIFPADFGGAGSRAAVKMALGRLARDGQIMRIGHGIYCS